MKKNLSIIVLIFLFIGSIFAQGEIISPETYASYYAEAFHGKKTANGEIFDMNAYTAAHRTLPFGTIVEVTNLENGKKVIVRINDRGPFVGDREIDISKAAAAALDMLSRGVTRVSLRKIDPTNLTALGVQKSLYNKPIKPVSPQIVNSNTITTQPIQPQASQPVQTHTTQEQYMQMQQQAQPVYPVQPQNTVQQEPAKREVELVQKIVQTQPAPQRKLVYTPAKASETSGPLWRIQLGSFKREENAMRLVIALRKINFEPAYEKTETHTRVVLHGIRPYELEKIEEILESNGFTDYILRQESW